MCKQAGNATFSPTHASQEPPLPDYVIFIGRCIIFALAHSLFAAQRTKRAFSRLSGSEPRFYRLFYNLASLTLFAWVMAAYRQSPLFYAVPAPGRWFLHAGQLAMSLIILRCVRQTGTADFLGISQLHASAVPARKLVTSGWYARVRHPLYLYSTLFLLMNPVMTAQWCLLTIFSITYFIVGGLIEERRLVGEFGDEYRGYRRRVPFMIPSLKGLNKE